MDIHLDVIIEILKGITPSMIADLLPEMPVVKIHPAFIVGIAVGAIGVFLLKMILSVAKYVVLIAVILIGAKVLLG